MNELQTAGALFAAETTLLFSIATWMWRRLTARFERDEEEMEELKGKYEQCLEDKVEFASQIARFEERTNSLQSEVERVRSILEVK